MDETAFRQRLSELGERTCSFDKAILARCVACSRSERMQIAEREVAKCADATSLSRCISLHVLLRRNFSFALKKLPGAALLTHAQEMRVQCGGLRALQKMLGGQCEVTDVDGLINSLLQMWGQLEDISYTEVVHGAGECYQGRHDKP
jgi:hypothetical protein